MNGALSSERALMSRNRLRVAVAGFPNFYNFKFQNLWKLADFRDVHRSGALQRIGAWPMPDRAIVAKELADIFKVIAHPDRIRIMEELRIRQVDVNSLADSLALPASRVSQHLSLLRAHRLVADRREGRRHIYHLSQPEIARWIVDGIDFLEGRRDGLRTRSINAARKLWTSGDSQNARKE